MPGAPDLKFDIVNPIQKPGQKKPWWAPVGQLSLWKDVSTGVWSGTCVIGFVGKEFRVFEAKPKPGGVPERGDTITDHVQDNAETFDAAKDRF